MIRECGVRILGNTNKPASPDADRLAELHAACLPDAWSERSFREMLADPAVRMIDAESGFLLWRDLGGEAELLTLCVAPHARRQGLATNLIRHMLAETGDCPVHLELRVSNAAACALYRSNGFVESGRRKAYYAADGHREDALLMRRDPVVGRTPD